METTKLNNSVEMPLLGYGLYKVAKEEAVRCISDAIDVGYRMIDTALLYGNEECVGKAIAESGIPREEFFVITKIWITDSGEEKARRAIDTALGKLRTDYADMLLVHQPFGDYYGTYRALEKALEEGKTRAIGVSNFREDRLFDLIYHSDIIPAVNQLETNVLSQQTAMNQIHSEYDIRLMAWAPLAQGRHGIAENKVLNEIGEHYNKTASQVALRFLVQQGIPAIPKSSDKGRMKENIEIFDFALSEEHMATIRQMNTTDSGLRDYTDINYVKSIITREF